MTSPLKEAVGRAIALRSPFLASIFLNDCPDAVSNYPADEIQQQNRYWRRQLEALEDVDTTAIREYLVDGHECGLGEWMRLFHIGLLPAIIAFSLPRSSAHA